MKKIALALLCSLAASPLLAKTVTAVATSPHGAAVQAGTTFQFTALCTYDDASTDDCTAAGGVTWQSSRTSIITVGVTGIASTPNDPATGTYNTALIIARVGSLFDSSTIVAQHPGDFFTQYITPDYSKLLAEDGSTVTPTNVAVGATIAVGSGIRVNLLGSGTGSAFNTPCNWVSSDVTKATVSRIGLVTAVAPGPVTITCNRQGNAVFSTTVTGYPRWQTPGNFINLIIVNGGTGNTTWYVRPDGGQPYTNATDTPHGQCTGLADVAYPGLTALERIPGRTYTLGEMIADETSGRYQTVTTAGTVIDSDNWGPTFSTTLNGTTIDGTVVWTAGATFPINQACAVGNLRYLWSNETGFISTAWVIQGGDTVIVRQNPNGYRTGGNAAHGIHAAPGNCAGNPCAMPFIPSGTAARHTKILGENFASCTADTAKTRMDLSSRLAFQLNDSQFVDVACFEVFDQTACASNGNFTNHCLTTGSSSGAYGIYQSAFTSYVNYTDMYIHGLASDGIFGATGVGVVVNRVHLKGLADAGVNMDDTPFSISNISTAGGFTMTNSLTEFIGCIEEFPVVHNYPYVECRDQTLGNYADGLGTASASGDWLFDHDIWRYNYQDGLDLLHSGMNNLTITNSQSYGNDGQQYKVGSGRNVIFRNNFTLHNCYRLAQPIGDEPLAAIVPGATYCRAGGDGDVVSIDPLGTLLWQNNTFVGYGSTSYDENCAANWDDCSSAMSVFQNNINVGLSDPLHGDGQLPGLFFTNEAQIFPPHQGWTIRDHNLFFNFRNGCPSTLFTGDICLDAKMVSSVPATITSDETVLDNFNWALKAASPAKFAGLAITGLTLDSIGNTYQNPPSMGALEYQVGTLLTVTVTPNPVLVTIGSPNTSVGASCVYSNGDTTPCTVVWTGTGAHSSINSTTGIVTGITVGSDTITATMNSIFGNATVTIAAPVLGVTKKMGSNVKFSGSSMF